MASDRGLHAAPNQAVSVDAYDRYIGRWSRMFVPSLLAAGRLRPGHRVLDVATGTGEAALMAISAAGQSGAVIGTDISAAMLTAARLRLPDSFRTVVTDGQALAFRDSSFDAVICQLGLMFFPDPPRGLSEFRRVLRSAGRAAICVISTPEKAPMWGVLAQALSRQLPARREALHLSFSLGDHRRLEAMLAEAGFRDISVAREERRGNAGSFEEYWSIIEAGTGQLPLIYASLPEPQRRAVRQEARAGLAEFEVAGRLELSVEMLIASGQA